MKPQDENRKLREYIRQSRQRRRWRRLTAVLATAAAVLTLCVMVLPAVTMESTPQTLACQLDLHTHTDSCYDEEGELLCGYAGFVAHTHDSSCYGEDGTLICPLEERKPHTHTESCYQETDEYIFNDTLSDGLTLQEDTIKVYIAVDKNDEVGDYIPLKKGDDYTLTTTNTENGGGSFSIAFDNLKTAPYIADGTRNYVIVTYDATLNANAEIGLDGNPNSVDLQFSNDPNGDGLGRTTEDTVIVFTYELDGTKVDGENEDTKLEGAEFVLFNGGHTRVAHIENGKLVGWVALPGGYDSDTYQQIPYETWETFNRTTNVIMTSAAEGVFGVSGLDDGTYHLMEIKAPNGYNLLEDDVQLVIAATTVNGQNWNGTAADALTALTITVDQGNAEGGNLGTGAVNVTVKNNQGATLPETGGMGTTLFYIIGGLLVVGAGILLVVRIRMRSHNE